MIIIRDLVNFSVVPDSIWIFVICYVLNIQGDVHGPFWATETVGYPCVDPPVGWHVAFIVGSFQANVMTFFGGFLKIQGGIAISSIQNQSAS